jgi:hypothetical protein
MQKSDRREKLFGDLIKSGYVDITEKYHDRIVSSGDKRAFQFNYPNSNHNVQVVFDYEEYRDVFIHSTRKLTLKDPSYYQSGKYKIDKVLEILNDSGLTKQTFGKSK